MLEVIKARRSIRAYTPEPVSEEDIQAMLEAAMAAPSASNLQPWEFVVVEDAALRGQLAQMHPYSGMAADAPVVFVVVGDKTASRHWVEDTSAATENLLLAATALGLGGVWVGVYPNTDREAYARNLLGVPEGKRVLCIVPVGHPAEQKPPRTQFDPAKVHRDRY
jgi:nitroreductase